MRMRLCGLHFVMEFESGFHQCFSHCFFCCVHIAKVLLKRTACQGGGYLARFFWILSCTTLRVAQSICVNMRVNHVIFVGTVDAASGNAAAQMNAFCAKTGNVPMFVSHRKGRRGECGV
jgi:hypothetical protein